MVDIARQVKGCHFNSGNQGSKRVDGYVEHSLTGSTAGDWDLATAAWRALHSCSGSGGAGAGAGAGTGAGPQAGSSSGARPFGRPVPLTGASDPCWVEATHSAHPPSRRLTVALRCRPPPASNAPNARGAAASVLAGVLRVGLHGPVAFADGAVAVVAHLGGAGGDGGAGGGGGGGGGGGDGGGGGGGGGGSDGEETTVTVELIVCGFGDVAVRPIVSYSGGQVSLRGAAYRVPLTELLTPAPMTLAAFDRLWGRDLHSFTFQLILSRV